MFDHNYEQSIKDGDDQSNRRMVTLNMDPETGTKGPWVKTIGKSLSRTMTANSWKDSTWIGSITSLMLGARTEYYFRYEGTQTIPPCYGPWALGSRGNTTHWRVMKDPIRVHPQQIQEMERLIKSRIAPQEEGRGFRCRPDTAGVVTADGHISVSRPLQNFSHHVMTFCECKNWRSRWPDDREWCDINDVQERFFEHPYNFRTDGF